MNKIGGSLALLFTDLNLGGRTGIDLVNTVKKRHPSLAVILTSGHGYSDLPADTVFMPKPWNALDVLIQAQRALENGNP